MALSYNLGYQESISVHPTRRQIFAGKPYLTFPNIWEWLVSPSPNLQTQIAGPKKYKISNQNSCAHPFVFILFLANLCFSLNIGNLLHLAKTTTLLNLLMAKEPLALFHFVFSSPCPPPCTSPCPYPPSHRSSLNWQLLLAAREFFPVVSKEEGFPLRSRFPTTS